MSSFTDMSEAEFATYANDLIDSYTTGLERKQAATYLQSINSIDINLSDFIYQKVDLTGIEPVTSKATI